MITPVAWGWAYLATLLAIGVLDALWLGFIARDFYQRAIGELMAPEVNKAAAAIFYLSYPIGLLALAVSPNPGSLTSVLWRAAVFGLVAYGTYDLTNMATLRNWSWTLVLIDLAWGVVITTAAAAAAYWALQKAT